MKLPGAVRWLTPVILLGVAGAWTTYLLRQSSPAPAPAASTPAPQAPAATPRPDFTLKDLSGKPHNIGEWSGKVIVLNFWATWCPPCQREIPMFKELQNQYGSQGLQFIGIAIDETAAVREFVQHMPLNYPLLVGQEDADKVSIDYGDQEGGLPYTVIIGRDDKIHYIQMGEMERNEVERVVVPLLQAAPR